MKRDRRQKRRSTRLQAFIALEGGFARRSCTVLDMSETGARLLFHDPVPHAANLRIVFGDDVRNAAPARVIWRRGNLAGLQFVNAKPAVS
jgi:hypothetical protein